MPYRRLLTVAVAAAILVFPATALADHGSDATAGVTLAGTIEIEHSDDFAEQAFGLALLPANAHTAAQAPASRRGRGAPRRRARRSERPDRGRRARAPLRGFDPAGPGADHRGRGDGCAKTVVIMFNFANDTRTPYTQDQLRSQVFTGAGSVNAYYQEQSFGLVSFTGKYRADGDVWGWFTIARRAARAQLHDLGGRGETEGDRGRRRSHRLSAHRLLLPAGVELRLGRAGVRPRQRELDQRRAQHARDRRTSWATTSASTMPARTVVPPAA